MIPLTEQERRFLARALTAGVVCATVGSGLIALHGPGPAVAFLAWPPLLLLGARLWTEIEVFWERMLDRWYEWRYPDDSDENDCEEDA